MEIGLICYQKTSSPKADHFDLKGSDAIVAFIAECKKKKNIQLCVYSAKQIKRKQLVCGSSVIDDDITGSLSKKICVRYIFLLSIFISIIYILFIFNKNF